MEAEMTGQDIRTILQHHWAASDASDFEAEHEIYCEDAMLEYPQSRERIRGRRSIQASRLAQPNNKRFKVRRILGAGDLWVSEFVLTYDGLPSYTVSIMEFRDGGYSDRVPIVPVPARWTKVWRVRDTNHGFVCTPVCTENFIRID
jgi:hypothetical protein